MGFDQPSNEFFASKDYNGHLVLFEDIGTVYEADTAYGKANAIKATVTVLSHPEGPKVFPQSSVFGAAMTGVLSRALPGRPVLGRIGQGVAKPGQDPPWVLNPFDPATDAPAAEAYVNARAAGQFQQAAPAAPPAPAYAPPVPQVAVPQVPQVAYAPPAAPAFPPAAAPAFVPPAAAPVPPMPGFTPPVAAPAPVAAAPAAVDVSTMTAEQWAELPPHVQQMIIAQQQAATQVVPY